MNAAAPDVLDSQVVRYAINGVVATGVHYLALTLCLNVLQVPSAGVSNALAATAGIGCSFLGNRHFVFRSVTEPALVQLGRFWVLYTVLAFFQGVILYLWSDIFGLDYRAGFLLGTGVQVCCTYFGGRHWVFSPTR